VERLNEFHAVAELLPLMVGKQFDELVEDIRANGLKLPIWRHDGKIIDGRNRYLACKKAGVEPKFQEWDGKGSLVRFVFSVNVPRRHLSESQRAMIAAKLATWKPGTSKQKAMAGERRGIPRPCDEEFTVPEAAEMLNVDQTTIREAKRVHRDGAPEVIAAVQEGEVSVHMAEKVLDLPKGQQPAALARKKLMKGKRRKPEPSSNGKRAAPARSEQMVKLNIDTNDPESAAEVLADALEFDFLNTLVTELIGIVNREKAARERGMAPAGRIS
jgi:hypothetical protein